MKFRYRLAIVVAALLLLGLFSGTLRFSIFKIVSVEEIGAWLERAQSDRFLAVGFYLFYAVGAMVLPITFFPIIGGLLFPYWIAMPLNVAAAVLGGWMSFRIGRYFGRAAIEPMLRGNLQALDRLAGSEGWRAVLAIRLIGMPPFLIANFGLGLSAVRNRDFILGSTIGIFPWMALVTYLSNSLWQAVLVGGEKGLAKALLHSVAPLSAVSMTVMAILGINWWLKRRRAARPHSNL